MTESFKRNITHDQKFEHLLIIGAASTGKTVSHINELTLYSVFHLQMETVTVIQNFVYLVKNSCKNLPVFENEYPWWNFNDSGAYIRWAFKSYSRTYP